GRRSTETHPNGVVTTTRYDKANRVTNIWTNKSGSVLESFAYSYDKAGNRVRMTEADGSWSSYRYDNLYRLLNESYSNGGSIGYTYDADGNRQTSRETIPLPSTYKFFANGDGDRFMWTPHGCTAHFNCIKEFPSDGDTTFVSASTVGYDDLYQLQDRDVQ